MSSARNYLSTHSPLSLRVVRQSNCAAIADFLGPFGHHHVTSLQAFEHFDFTGATMTDDDFRFDSLAVANRKHELLVALGNERLFRDHECRDVGAAQMHGHEHSGLQFSFAVRQLSTDQDRSTHGIDATSHRQDGAAELLAAVCRGGCIDLKTFLQYRQESFRYRKVHFHDAEIIECRDHRARTHESADTDIAQSNATAEWRANHLLVVSRLGG